MTKKTLKCTSYATVIHITIFELYQNVAWYIIYYGKCCQRHLITCHLLCFYFYLGNNVPTIPPHSHPSYTPPSPHDPHNKANGPNMAHHVSQNQMGTPQRSSQGGGYHMEQRGISPQPALYKQTTKKKAVVKAQQRERGERYL